ncbi:MAG: dTDP-4-dehydrorhamnose reductase [Chlamydiales bacterium]|nr:dTDP-4-dehydrorhamnose reductase [Chlamydiales bacterium]
MSILLVGKTGMLSQDIASTLVQKGYEVDIPSIEELDITSSQSINSFSKDKQYEYIINAAAYTQVDLAEDNKEIAYEINAKGVINLLDLAKKNDAKLIHFSTDYVFNGKKRSPYTENDSPAPINVYGKSKLDGEAHIQMNTPHHLIIRLSWLCGLHGTNFITTMIRLMKSKEELKVVNDQMGSPTFCHEVASALPKLLNASGIYHLANQGSCSWYDFACAIFDYLKRHNIKIATKAIVPIKSSEYPTRATRPKNSILNTEKAEKELGIKLSSWEDSLEYYLDKHFENILLTSST